MRKALALGFVVLPVLLAGCFHSGQIVGGKPRPKEYSTAVSLSPGATEILRLKVYKLKLVGRTAACNRPFVDNTVRVVMSGTKPNYEMIAALQPSIVFYDRDLFAEGDLAKFKELGIDTYAIYGDTIDEFIDCLYRLQAKVGNEKEVMEYADQIFAARQSALGNPIVPKPRVAVLMPGSGGEHMIAGLDSFQADVIRATSADAVGPKARLFVPLSAEEFVSQNPDVIVSAGDPSSILSDPRFQTVSAIKRRAVVHVNPDIMLRRGASVADLIRDLAAELRRLAQSGGAK